MKCSDRIYKVLYNVCMYMPTYFDSLYNVNCIWDKEKLIFICILISVPHKEKPFQTYENNKRSPVSVTFKREGGDSEEEGGGFSEERGKVGEQSRVDFWQEIMVWGEYYYCWTET